MRHLILAAVLVLTSLPAFAQNTPSMPKPLADHKARGAQVYYLGRYDILEGWVMIRAGQPEFYYSTPGSNAIVMGLLFSPDGELITTSQLEKLPLDTGLADMMTPATPPAAQVAAPAAAAPAPQTPAPAATPTPAAAPPAAASVADELVPNTPANKMYLEVQAAGQVVFGEPGKPAFYAFIDPNCQHCQRFMREIEPYVSAGTVAVHILPVGFDDRSKRQAAFLLGAADGGMRMAAYAKGQSDQLPAPEGLATQAVERNVDLMRNWGMDATPMLVYRAAGDKKVRIVRGRPHDLAATVKDLTGQ